MYDAIIIGISVERIVCAINLLKNNKKVLIVESNDIEEYQKKEDKTLKYITKYVKLECNLKDKIISLGGEIIYGNIDSINIKNKIMVIHNTKFTYKSLILCFGLIQDLPNIANMHNYIGNGVHFCTFCDKNMYKNKIIGVLGKKVDIKDILDLSDISYKTLYFKNYNDNDINEISKINNVKVIDKSITKLMGDNRLKIIQLNDEIIKMDALFLSNGYVPNTKYIEKYISKEDLEDKIVFIEKENNEMNISEGLYLSRKVIEYLNIL